jgi:hypothetical protein
MNFFGNFKFLVGKNGSHSEMRILGCDIILVGGVQLLPLGAIGDEVGGVTTLEAAPR